MQTTRTSNLWRGVAYTVAAMLCFALMSTAVRWVAATVPTPQMVFLRNVLSLFLVSAWIFLRYDARMLRTTRMWGHGWRAGLGFLAMEIWFYSLSILPLTTATALSFTTPVFATLFAMWILKEKAGWRRWAAIMVSFVGVLVILRPGAELFNPSASIVLLSSALMALAGVVVKSLTRTEHPETIVFYLALLMTPLSLAPALLTWGPVSGPEWLAIGFIAFTSTAAHLLIARAYKHAEMVVVLPLDFTRLLFTGMLAYVFFDERMDHTTLVGAAIIMASVAYIVHREAVRRRGATEP